MTVTNKYISQYTGALYDEAVGKVLNSELDSTLMVSTTYAELKNLRDTGQLKPGLKYRITDYEFLRYGYTSAKHLFDIVVTATSESEINENAMACLHEGDTYFTKEELAGLTIKYTLDYPYSLCHEIAALDLTLVTKYAIIEEYGTDYIDFYLYFVKDDIYYWISNAETSTSDTFFTSSSDLLNLLMGGQWFNWADAGSTDSIDNWINLDKGVIPSAYGESSIIEEGDFPAYKGTILYMKDLNNNECNYDFKNALVLKYGKAEDYNLELYVESGTDPILYFYTFSASINSEVVDCSKYNKCCNNSIYEDRNILIDENYANHEYRILQNIIKGMNNYIWDPFNCTIGVLSSDNCVFGEHINIGDRVFSSNIYGYNIVVDSNNDELTTSGTFADNGYGTHILSNVGSATIDSSYTGKTIGKNSSGSIVYYNPSDNY